jgi:hypothetical protein
MLVLLLPAGLLVVDGVVVRDTVLVDELPVEEDVDAEPVTGFYSSGFVLRPI